MEPLLQFIMDLHSKFTKLSLEERRLDLGIFLDFSTTYIWYCRIDEGYVCLFSSSLHIVKSKISLEVEFWFALREGFFWFFFSLTQWDYQNILRFKTNASVFRGICVFCNQEFFLYKFHVGQGCFIIYQKNKRKIKSCLRRSVSRRCFFLISSCCHNRCH